MADARLTVCPKCDAPELKKLVSAVAFRLKGSGWYETDFKTGNKKNLDQADSGSKPDSSSKSESDSKPDSSSKSESGSKPDSSSKSESGSKPDSSSKPESGSKKDKKAAS